MAKKLLTFKDFLPNGLVSSEDSELDTYIKYRQRRMRRIDTTSEQTKLDEIQIGWHHKTQKHHTIKHPDGSHYGVYDHSSYGKSGYEIRKIKDKDGNSLRAKDSRKQSGDRYMAGATGGPTAAAKKWVAKHGGTIHNHKVKEDVDWVCGQCNCDPCTCEGDVHEALTIQQRMARGRQMKRMKGRIKIGRDRAKRRMASKDTIEKRAQKAARKLILKKLTKGVDKGDLPFARRQELEKRMDKPAIQKRVKMLAKRLFKDLRKKEVERKKA